MVANLDISLNYQISLLFTSDGMLRQYIARTITSAGLATPSHGSSADPLVQRETGVPARSVGLPTSAQPRVVSGDDDVVCIEADGDFVDLHTETTTIWLILEVIVGRGLQRDASRTLP